MEDDGYDPACSELFDDSEIAYQPTYVTPGPYDDSSDDFSDDERSEDGLSDHCESSVAHSTNRQDSSDFVQKHELVGKLPVIPGVTNRGGGGSDNNEYHVQPLLDNSTPAYAPSQTLGSPSASSVTSSVSGGYPSPVSSIQPSILAMEGPEHYYQPSFKSEVSSPESDLSDGDLHLVRNQPSQYSIPMTSSATPTESFPAQSPAVKPVTENLFDDFDGNDIDDNRLNEDFEGFERDEQPESQVDGIIADIFGESDVEEEFEGFAENEIEKELELDHPQEKPSDLVKTQPAAQPDHDEGDEHEEEEFVSDFDQVMARKRTELGRRRRRHRDIEFLNDSDDLILATISRMKEAAENDRQLLTENRPATKKLKMISEVSSLLRRADLKSALVDNGMLSAITDWLAPLPGHTLPNLIIRDTMLNCLRDFQLLSSEVLQDSGIGKALMYLYKHPLETRANKDKAGRLINEWLRPIFNLTSDYRTLTKEERKQLDYEHLPKRRNIDNENYDHRDINREMDGEPKGLLRPGDPGWIGRARVPQPSNKDYIVRPKWRVSDGNRSAGDEDGEGEEEQTVFRRKRRVERSSGLGTTSRIKAHIRNLSQLARQKQSKATRAVTMSVEGRRLAL